MPREVTVGLTDLKKLVGMCMDQKIDAQAQTMVLTEPGHSDQNAAIEFAHLVEDKMPEATKKVRSHFRSLLEALESGEGVKDALASLVEHANPASLRR